ncbi:phenylacetate--CoA ligase family protein [Brevibacillus fluminis]|uniref:Phenylacetate--CoA ligase family protein n=1 Tax=Brevibacillus fluminis TaxID=511487 RepID=A0A3M8DHS4_9BACL|nr:AMP-binding protein [Brevibacillus fluminis]RNB87643.1 phenylacetate--CoA ligase family protein [Brevibacillus fluminis]
MFKESSSTSYWNEIEGKPWSEIEQLTNRKLQQQVHYLYENSIFYQGKFKEAGVRPEHILEAKDLNKIPYTIKAEVRESLQKEILGLHRAVPRDRVIQIQATSGTTGKPAYVGATKHDVHVWSEMGARAMYANGFRPGDWAVHAFSMSKGFVGGLVMVQILQHMDVCEIPIGAEVGVAKMLQMIQDLSPDAIVGTPNFIMYLGERCEDVLGIPARELSIRKISVGGEPGGAIPAFRTKLENLWGADVRDMMGGADFGSTYWGECEEKDGMHFCGQGYLLPQLIHPESGEFLPIEPGVEGELVYSAIDRQCSPLLKYRSSDLVRIIATSCSCGRTSFKIKSLGRSDDMLIVRGINVFPSAVKDCILQFQPMTTGQMRILVDFEGHSTQNPLHIKVEYAEGLESSLLDGLKKEIELKMKAALAINTIVNFVPAGSLEPPGAQKVPLIERINTKEMK